MVQSLRSRGMKSVPPRGSGSLDCRLALSPTPIANRQLTVGNQRTHPLPRGGTDFIPQGFANQTVEISVLGI